jgi:hypothetical protein
LKSTLSSFVRQRRTKDLNIQFRWASSKLFTTLLHYILTSLFSVFPFQRVRATDNPNIATNIRHNPAVAAAIPHLPFGKIDNLP